LKKLEALSDLAKNSETDPASWKSQHYFDLYMGNLDCTCMSHLAFSASLVLAFK
jgi:hypothetical protein